jgi:hypothetical protein
MSRSSMMPLIELGKPDGGVRAMSDQPQTAAEAARAAAFEEAATIAERAGKRLSREAEQFHASENYDAFEEADGRACLAYYIAGRIRSKAKRGVARAK